MPNETSLFFREVMSACLSLEQPLSIAFLGPFGKLLRVGGEQAFRACRCLLPQNSIDDVFREVERACALCGRAGGKLDRGAVGWTMDLLLLTSLKICGEVVCVFTRNLLSRAADLSAIQKVYSYAQVAGAVPPMVEWHVAAGAAHFGRQQCTGGATGCPARAAAIAGKRRQCAMRCPSG